jgi:hypothetical protein
MYSFNPVPKPSHKRSDKITQRKLGEISPKVRKVVYERSGGVCERCHRSRGHHLAHLVRRPQMTAKTSEKDLAHLCVACHKFADESGREGREWLKSFAEGLRSDRTA